MWSFIQANGEVGLILGGIVLILVLVALTVVLYRSNRDDFIGWVLLAGALAVLFTFGSLVAWLWRTGDLGVWIFGAIILIISWPIGKHWNECGMDNSRCGGGGGSSYIGYREVTGDDVTQRRR